MKPMKPISTHRRFAGMFAAVFSASSLLSPAEVTVEGGRDENGPEDYSQVTVQSTASGWGAANVLANLHAKQEGTKLFLHLAGSASGNAQILFLDTKPGGVNFIPSNLITSGGEEGAINQLGSSSTSGMTFESGFGADYAIRIYGQGSDAHVNLYDLQTGVRSYVGNSGSTLVSGGIISEMKTIWGQVALADYATATLGVEIALPLAAMGVPAGPQNVKMTAILVNGGSDYGSNQVLGSRTGPSDIAGGLSSLNFETEPGTQTLTFAVEGPPAVLDPNGDADNDGLLNGVETNTGIFVSASDTGSKPLLADTDSDGYSDGQEVGGTALGYVADPNTANYVSMAVPGSFTDPGWAPDGSAGNAMTQGSTASLTEQHQWALNYRFTNFGAIQYKYAANGTWDKNWGLNGGNFESVIATTGFHTFSFNSATQAQSLTRTVFPTVQAYLEAYNLSSGSDTDGDGISNEAEFTANSDPTTADTDGDGVSDAADANPLAATRNIVFRVNMSVQQALENFDAAQDSVVVDFFTGLAANLPDLQLTPIGGGIWTGTLQNIQGPTGAPLGEYKFRHNHPGAADGGYEGAISNRSLNLGPANTTQTLDVVFFNDNATMPGGGFSTWAQEFADGQGPDEDFDGDGVQNGIEYFMGQTTAAFTANPQIVNGVIAWPRSASASDVTYEVLTSENLTTWTDVTAQAVEANGLVSYTLPSSSPKRFVRLKVTVGAP